MKQFKNFCNDKKNYPISDLLNLPITENCLESRPIKIVPDEKKMGFKINWHKLGTKTTNPKKNPIKRIRTPTR